MAALAAPGAAERDSAVARLELIGSRAILALVDTLRTGSENAREGAVLVLGRSDDPRARKAVLAAVADAAASVAGHAVAILARRPDAAAARALAAGLRHTDAGVRRAAAKALAAAFAFGVAEATEPVVDLLLDERTDEDSRLAALEAVAGLPSRQRRPLLARVEGATGSLGRRLAALRGEAAPEARRVAEIAAGLDQLPSGAKAVPALHERLKRIAEVPADVEGAWELRLRLHRELAGRDSRIALYDLREMLEHRPPRDVSLLLDLAARLGDASFVPALAALAHDAPKATDGCVAALAALMQRERLNKSHRSVKAVPARHRAALDALWHKARDRRRS